MKSILLRLILLLPLHCLAQAPEANLQKLGIELPSLQTPLGSYVAVVKVDHLLYLSGKGPLQTNGQYIKGKLGKDLSIESGYQAARLTAINQLAVLKNELGDLRRVKRIIKVNGFVNSEGSFYDHPKVMDGFSDLLVQVFGEKGKHARTALGVAALPLNMAVEVEMIVEVE
ncbi:RidA family protein [Cytophagaceae bacterium YF14B1]|uniref:RidA family protein n=1 Tax=Xanthocytophaga flava TaxID=3048013 RepID=A0AAE3U885_9BACT|nr:RidA family protein [Xanthocytophaga flavus]MDJ1480933.1 RidA family protein [Xanthocytophaga flavus]